MATKSELAVPEIRTGQLLSRNSNSEQSTRRPKFTVTSARQYADMVLAHANARFGDSLYAGSNYVSLAEYLQKPYRIAINTSVSFDTDAEPDLVTLHDLRLPEKDDRRVEHFGGIKDFIRTCEKKRQQPNSSLLLFVRGYPSPDWLNHIGWLCNVDPEFFLRHLDFVHSPTERGCFTSPNLPSSNANILRLRLPTIVYRQLDRTITQKEIEELRHIAAGQMKEYQTGLKQEKNIDIGDSVVRSFAVHDQEHYSIEQDVSVCVDPFGKGWITIVWLDHGRDLMRTLGPWARTMTRSHRWKTSIVPTIMHRPEIALKTAHITGNRATRHTMLGGFPQSGSIIHAHYGRFLDVNTSMSDPFYTLSELFNFLACSEIQFLNMTEQKISAEMDNFTLSENRSTAEESIHGLTLSNLLYNRKILDQHIVRLKDYVAYVKASGGSKWPRASDEKQKAKAMYSRTALLEDFQYLLDKATTLAQTCERGMGIAGNNAMVAESRSAIDLAKRVSKLTTLAFFFVPASFLTSLFGMNFVELGSGYLRIWIWVVIMISMYLGILIIIYFDVVMKLVTKVFQVRSHGPKPTASG